MSSPTLEIIGEIKSGGEKCSNCTPVDELVIKLCDKCFLESLQSENSELKAEVERLYRSTRQACPCLYLEAPCNPNCTCRKPLSSRGCEFCCSYGSVEQRKFHAQDLQQRLANELENIARNDWS